MVDSWDDTPQPSHPVNPPPRARLEVEELALHKTQDEAGLACTHVAQEDLHAGVLSACQAAA